LCLGACEIVGALSQAPSFWGDLSLQTVAFNGTNYQIPNRAGENGWATVLTTFLAAVATSAQTTSNQRVGTRVALTTPVTVAATDYAVIVKLTTPAAVAVSLPAGAAGRTFVVVDGTGDAYTNNITITANGTDKIQGAATYVVNENYGSLTLVWDAAAASPSWRIASSFSGDNPVVAGMRITAGTASTSTTSGTVIVTGGAGVSGAIYAGSLQDTPIGSTTRSSGAFTTLGANGAVTMTAGTASTSTGTGTLVVTGGLGASGAIYASSLVLSSSATVGGNTTGDSNLGTISSVTLSSYYEGTFTVDFSVGMNTGTNNVTVQYRRVGRLVTIILPQTLVTAGVSIAYWNTASAAIPSALRPSTTSVEGAVVTTSGSRDVSMGQYEIKTNGAIEVNRTTGSWVATTANCGFQPFSVTYNCA